MDLYFLAREDILEGEICEKLECKLLLFAGFKIICAGSYEYRKFPYVSNSEKAN